MEFPEIERLSPNRDPKQHERLGALFHHSELGFEETIARMLDPLSQVSYHCLIDRDGRRCSFVPDTQIAWHAGASRFLGRDRCNEFMLGVAFAGDTYRLPLTGDQIASALDWLGPRWKAFGWSMGRITDHRQAAPGRKRDLNPQEWERLQAAIGAGFGSTGSAGRVSELKSPAPSRT